MKTTLDLSDPLLVRAKVLARKRGTTLRSLTEAGLRKVLEADEASPPRLQEPMTYKDRGLSPEFQEAGWREIRDAAYTGR